MNPTENVHAEYCRLVKYWADALLELRGSSRLTSIEKRDYLSALGPLLDKLHELYRRSVSEIDGASEQMIGFLYCASPAAVQLLWALHMLDDDYTGIKDEIKELQLWSRRVARPRGKSPALPPDAVCRLRDRAGINDRANRYSGCPRSPHAGTRRTCIVGAHEIVYDGAEHTVFGEHVVDILGIRLIRQLRRDRPALLKRVDGAEVSQWVSTIRPFSPLVSMPPRDPAVLLSMINQVSEFILTIISDLYDPECPKDYRVLLSRLDSFLMGMVAYRRMLEELPMVRPKLSTRPSKGMRQRQVEQRLARVESLFQQGFIGKEIAAALGVAPSTITGYFKRLGKGKSARS